MQPPPELGLMGRVEEDLHLFGAPVSTMSRAPGVRWVGTGVASWYSPLAAADPSPLRSLFEPDTRHCPA
eukprot:NODE_3225_length_961_cov_4.044956_g2680_i0.p2 GENE.NODE_3225_length_961_cov_4.044956_g2680_i0~~NODE_3225_length_961_cov_4.044956_g2680_i0.p2  ORF type:complete len:69 (+),score=6.72 NODE_3225_length_961_cov_4.044956_g2680_i0:290-496(+)